LQDFPGVLMLDIHCWSHIKNRVHGLAATLLEPACGINDKDQGEGLMP